MGKTRMFGFVRYTCNPIVGCYHGCVYCWARKLAKRLRKVCEDCYNFIPHTHIERLYKDFKKGVFKRTPSDAIIFLCDMSDLFGSWVSDDIIMEVLSFIKYNPQTTFFLETKNPARMLDFIDEIPKNTIVSTTIETNQYPIEGISNAPSPIERAIAFILMDHPHKHVSIEPIIDFDMDTLIKWIKDIRPERVSMGYDNYGILKKNGIPEPSKEKYFKLKAELNKFTYVEDKTFGESQSERLIYP